MPRTTLTVVALVLAEAALLFPKALFRGESFFERDLLVDWYQRLSVLSRCLREGAWPVWDPSIGFGYPLIADPGAQILYPPAWAAFALPLALGYTAFVLLHLVLGALGMARLSRGLGLGPHASVVAACAWAACGPVQSTLNLRHHFAASAWAPWVLLAVDAATRVPSVRSAVLAALAVAGQASAGSPDVSILTVLVATPWALVRLVDRPRRGRRALPGLALGAALAVALTAGQWWPALDVLRGSPRRALSEQVRGYWSVPPSALPRTVLPLDPRSVPYDPRAWTRLFDAPEPPFLASVYLGGAALLLAVTSVLAPWRRRRALALALLALVAVAAAAGPHTPLYGWLTAALPWLKILRYPSKAYLVVAPLVCLLVGSGVDAVGRSRAGLRVAIAATALAGGLVTAAALDVSRVAAAGWLAGPALLLASAVVLVAAALARLGARRAVPALGALCVLDLVAAHADLNATARIETLLAPPPAARLARAGGGRRVYVYDYHSVRGEAQRHLGRGDAYWTAAPPAGVDRRVYEAFARTLYMPAGLAGLFGLEGSYEMDLRGLSTVHVNDLDYALRRLEGTPAHVRLLRVGAVGTVLSLHRRGLEDLRLEASLPSLFPEPILVWTVRDSPPRAWLVGCAREADGAAAFRRLTQESFEPSSEVIVTDRGSGPVGPSGCGPAGTARFDLLHADRIRIEAVASKASWLVLADAWTPGWRVTVDGRPADLARANLAFRAVALGAGRHVVEMVYRPLAVTAGLLVSGGTLALLGVAAAASAWRGARGRPAR